MEMKIEIFTARDRQHCETCGTNYDEGGHVLIDGKEVFRYDPLASCWGNANYSEGDLLFLALREIGIEVTVDDEVPYSLTKYNGDVE